MTDTTNYKFKEISQGDQSPYLSLNTNMISIDAALSAVSHFSPRNSVNYDSNGNLVASLTFGYCGGLIRKGVAITTKAAGALVLTASSTNYVEIDESGVVSFNTTGFTPGKFPLATVTTDATKKTAITDKRTWLEVPRNPLLAKDVSGGADVTLSASESLHDIIAASGALTADINLVVATISKQWTVANLTSGAYTLTVKTAAGSGVAIAQGMRAIVYCDGTDVVRATADV